MKIKWMCMIFMLVLALNLSACGNRQENSSSPENGTIKIEPQSKEDYLSENIGNESSNMNVIDLQDDGTDKKIMEVGTVKDSAFPGKVKGCYYADGSRIIVEADKLCLYDTAKGETIASADISMKELCVQTYVDGCFIVGQGNGGGRGSSGSFAASESSGGITGYILNKDFAICDTISFGGFQGLYIYDTSSRKVRTILNYSEEGTADHMQIVTMDSLTFTGDNTLIYVGMATDTSNGGDGFSVYGTVSIDSANLTIIKKADYKVAVEEVEKGGNLLIMPQSFDKNNGTLLMLDTASNTEKTMSFSSRNEGKDGVTINIYDTASGKCIHTETVQGSNSAYFLRVPQILILDESDTCIVVLGRGIDEVSTLITTFGFAG